MIYNRTDYYHIKNINKKITFKSNFKSDNYKLPLGVSYNKATKKFTSQITYNNRIQYLGLYAIPEEAEKAYLEMKKQIKSEIQKQYQI